MIKHKRTKRGSGIIAFFKPLVNRAMEYKDVIAKDVFNIGENTKDIIKEVKT